MGDRGSQSGAEIEGPGLGPAVSAIHIRWRSVLVTCVSYIAAEQMTPKFSSLKLNLKTELIQETFIAVSEGQEPGSGLAGGSGSGSLMRLQSGSRVGPQSLKT